MAQLKEILEIEKKREEGGQYSTIYLFPEGTFYRAYEWSAWLCCRNHASCACFPRRAKDPDGVYGFHHGNQATVDIAVMIIKKEKRHKKQFIGGCASLRKERSASLAPKGSFGAT